MNQNKARDISPCDLTILLGMPRSGTSLIMRHLAAHSKILGIMEPFQSRRNADYRCVSFLDLLRDYDFENSKATSILLKETTTRIDNVKLSFELLDNARLLGTFCSLILVIRSPLECYLSQVNASKNMWKEKKMTEVNFEQFRVFCYVSLLGVAEIIKKISLYNYRITTYNFFIENHKTEIARLLAMLPLRAEVSSDKKLTQLKGGDPYSRNNPHVRERNTKDISVLMSFIDKGSEIEHAAYEIHKISQICSLDQLNDNVIDSIAVILSKAGLFKWV